MLLITAAGTHLGRDLVRHLGAKNYPLRAFDLLDRPWFAGHQAILGDITDPVAVRRAVRDVETIVHLAEANPLRKTVDFPAQADYSDHVQRINYEATRTLANAAIKAGVKKFVYASHVSVYGPPPKVCPCTEETPANPHGPFGRSKLAAEEFLLDKFKQGELDVVILRLAPVIGPHFIDHRYVEDWLEWKTKRPVQPFFGNNMALVHFVHVRDALDVIERCLSRPQAAGRVYNIAGRSAATTLEVFETVDETLASHRKMLTLPSSMFPVTNKVAAWLGRPLVYPEFARERFAHSCFAIERACNELGWRPKYDTLQAFAEAAAGYLERNR